MTTLAKICAAAALPSVLGQAGQPMEDHYQLPHHSFQSPVTYDDALPHWFMSGATMPSKKSVILVPGILGRAGMFFNKQPILTSDFNLETEFSFQAPQRPHNPDLNLDQKFAFWYVHTNTTAAFSETVVMNEGSWETGLEKMGWDTVGFKNDFDGLGVVFSNSPGGGPRQQVSMITNDGIKPVREADIFKQQTKPVRFRSTDRLNKIVLKVRVKDASAAVEVWMNNQQAHRFEIHSDLLHKGGYIGFTAWTGKAGDQAMGAAPGTQADRVEIYYVRAHNMDLSTAGEELDDPDSSTYVDWVAANEQAQRQMLERVLARLTKHHQGTVKLQRESFNSIVNLQNRVNELEGTCAILKKEYQMLGKDGTTAVKDQLIGMRKLFQTQARSREQTISQMKAGATGAGGGHSAESVQDFAEKNRKMVEELESQNSSFIFWIGLVMISGVGVVFALYSKMQAYERKHLL